jgi:hypothetical protein
MYLAPITSANFPKLWPGGRSVECRLHWRLKARYWAPVWKRDKMSPKALVGPIRAGAQASGWAVGDQGAVPPWGRRPEARRKDHLLLEARA